MGRVIAVGPAVEVSGWALAGVDVRPAESPEQARAVADDLPADVALLIISADVAEATAGRSTPAGALTVVLGR